MPSFDPADYVQVNERLEKFRADHPTWALVSDLLHHDEKTFIVRALISDDSGRCLATGMAEEIRGTSPVNKTSPLENCETSAWGRALANLGYDVRRAIASREEMEKVERAQASSSRQGAAARGEAKAVTPAPPSPPGLDERRQVLWSKVSSLSPAEIEKLKVWLAEREISLDFGTHTSEQIDIIEAELVESYQDPF